MSGSANVTSIETVERFRTALCEFVKEAKDGLSAIDMQIRRTFDWLDQQTKNWQREIRVRQEELVRAKIELESRKAMCKDGRGPGTTDQEKAFRKAQMRLKDAEEKLKCCRRWVPQLQHEVHEYHGPARLLSGVLDTEMLQALALLAQKLADLEAYLSLAPPSPTGAAAESGVTDDGSGLETARAGSPEAVATEPQPGSNTPSSVQGEANHEPQQQRDGAQ